MENEVIPQVNISSVQGLRRIDFIDNDFAIFDDVSDVPMDEFPNRINAAVIAVCLTGSGKVGVNLREFEVTAGTLLMTLPDQIIQSLGVSDDFSDIYIAVSPQFIDRTFTQMKELLSFMFYIKEHPCIPLSKTDVYNFCRKHMPVDEIRPKPRKEELFEKFMREVSACYKMERSVIFYANKLCLTPKHLSGVVKEVSGKTAGEWIDNFVILEARALLKSSEMSVQEIAEYLHFANQSFFGKYFKHYVGMSPKEYRRS